MQATRDADAHAPPLYAAAGCRSELPVSDSLQYLPDGLNGTVDILFAYHEGWQQTKDILSSRSNEQSGIERGRHERCGGFRQLDSPHHPDAAHFLHLLEQRQLREG